MRLCSQLLEMYLVEAYNFVFGLVNQLAWSNQPMNTREKLVSPKSV